MSAKLALLVALLAVLSTGLSCVTPESAMREETEEFHEVFAVKPDMSLSVENRNGSVNIQTWDNDSVDVFALKKTRAGRRQLKKVKIKIEQEDKILIRSDYANRLARVSVNYEIKVPKTLVVDRVETANGSVNLTGVKGDVEATTSNGKVALEGVDGYVTATTQNGAIDISSTTGVVKATTSNGRISAEVLGIRNSGADFTVSNGNIGVFVGDGLDVDVEMGTTNGKIDVHNVEVKTTESTRTRIKGKIGQGGPRIYARNTNGNIDLYKLTPED
jgi:hypothetical protein